MKKIYLYIYLASIFVIYQSRSIDPPHLPTVLFPAFNASLGRTPPPSKEMPPLTIPPYNVGLDDPWPLARPSKASCPRACPTILICPSDFDSLSGGRKRAGGTSRISISPRRIPLDPLPTRYSIEMRDKRDSSSALKVEGRSGSIFIISILDRPRACAGSCVWEDEIHSFPSGQV